MLEKELMNINEAYDKTLNITKELLDSSKIETFKDIKKTILDKSKNMESIFSDVLQNLNLIKVSKESETEDAKKEVSFLGKITFGLFDSADHKKHKNLKNDLEIFNKEFDSLKININEKKSNINFLINNKKSELIEEELINNIDYQNFKTTLNQLKVDVYYTKPINEASAFLSKAEDTQYSISRAFSEIRDAIYAEQRDAYDGGVNDAQNDRRCYWETEEANDAIQKVNREMKELGDYGRSIETVSNSYFELFDFDLLDISRLKDMENDLKRTEDRLLEMIRNTKNKRDSLMNEWNNKQNIIQKEIDSKINEVIVKYSL